MTIRRIQISDARLVTTDIHLDVDDAVGELEEQLEAAGYTATLLTVGGRRFAEHSTVADLAIEHGSVIGCGHHDPGVILANSRAGKGILALAGEAIPIQIPVVE